MYELTGYNDMCQQFSPTHFNSFVEVITLARDLERGLYTVFVTCAGRPVKFW